jgi:uncharacterized protein YecE (DUF72 family)
MPLFVGTSGWQYRHWVGRFYPRGPRPADDLVFYAARFQTVELNGTFYRLPAAATFAAWAQRTPPDFVFALKASRYLTHIKRLKDPTEPVQRLMARAVHLGVKLGPVLLQLPPTLSRDIGRLRDALAAFSAGVRVAVEFRHESWFTDETRRLLELHGAALCLADRGSKLVTPAWRTADWGYVRFHWGTATPASCYEPEVLAARAELVATLWGPAAAVYAYFNNDPHACALADAVVFAAAARRVGLQPTRVPERAEIAVG